MYPALAAVSELPPGPGLKPGHGRAGTMEDRPPETAVRWIGSVGGMERELVAREGIAFDAIQAGQVVGIGLRGLAGLVKLVVGTIQALRIVWDWKPDVLFVTGGYTATPVAVPAGWRGFR